MAQPTLPEASDHTFRLVSADGKSTFVKFHWKPKLGLQSTVWDEALKLAGADPDFHRRDLFEALAKRVADAVAMPLPAAAKSAAPVIDLPPSPAARGSSGGQGGAAAISMIMAPITLTASTRRVRARMR